MAVGWGGGEIGFQCEQEFLSSVLSRHQALKRIQDNNTIFCLDEDCGLEIAAARRALIPGALFCVSCASKHGG